MALFDTSKLNIPFMKHRRIAAILSVILVIGSFVLFMTKGINLGVDFTGGVEIQVRLAAEADIAAIREALNAGGFSQVMIQIYDDGSTSIRYQEPEEDARLELVVRRILEDRFGTVIVEKIDKVGPVVGEELRNQTIVAVVLAICAILFYMAFRFRFRFGVAAIAGLIHVSIIVLGAYSLTGREVGTWFIAAILIVIGYSLNDTIVLLDRVRENWLQIGRMGVTELVNASINQVLARTINTSITTLLPVLAMYFLGVEVMSNLAFAFMIGIIVGTYTSIYVVSSLIVEWYLRKPARR